MVISPSLDAILPTCVESFLNSEIIPSLVVLFNTKGCAEALVIAVNPLCPAWKPIEAELAEVLPHKKLPEESILTASEPLFSKDVYPAVVLLITKAPLEFVYKSFTRSAPDWSNDIPRSPEPV